MKIMLPMRLAPFTRPEDMIMASHAHQSMFAETVNQTKIALFQTPTISIPLMNMAQLKERLI
jgi:hypothetical protein